MPSDVQALWDRRPSWEAGDLDRKRDAQPGVVTSPLEESYTHNYGPATLAHDGQRPFTPGDARRGMGVHGGGLLYERHRGSRGSPSSSPGASRRTDTGPPGLNPMHALVRPPNPGEHPSFDAKVAAEFFRLRDAREGGAKTKADRGGSGREPAADLTFGGGPSPPRVFEADVERTMRELEQQMAKGGSLNNNTSTTVVSTRQRLPLESGERDEQMTGIVGPMSSPSSRYAPPLPAPRQEQELQTGILSQMDMHRAAPARGTSRSGGLRDMWGGGASYVQDEPQHRRHGGGLADMWQVEGEVRHGLPSSGVGRSEAGLPYSHRQGPGLKGMWNGGDSMATPPQPQRQGPGLRGLWSEPADMATADAARNDAKAAYHRALDRDAQQRRAMSGDAEPTQLLNRDRRGSIPYAGSSGLGNARDNNGTSLLGIGAAPGVGLPSARGTTPRQGMQSDFEEQQERLKDKAKKAAYADELRRQIAEKTARKVEETNALGGGNGRRASRGMGFHTSKDGGDVAPPFEGGNHRDDREGPGASWDVPSNDLPFVHGVVDREPVSPIVGQEQVSPARHVQVMGYAASEAISPGVGEGPPVNDEASATAARRRLVEDVYGGGRMGATLGGSGYRRALPGSSGILDGKDGSAVPGVNQIGGGDSTASSRGHLGMRVCVKSPNESEPEERWQKRAAALEQQRALQEQIAAKARVKKEEEDRRKREEEEEAGQQRERLRKLEADAEEERRRKQAQQQEQLEGLYRQQEEALRKKRGGGEGGGSARRDSDGGAARGGNEGARTPVHGAASPGGALVDIDTSRYLQAQRYAGGNDNGFNDIAMHHTSRPLSVGTGATDIDDLPAGAQARAEVLRHSPDGASGASPSWIRPISSGDGHAEISFAPGERRAASSPGYERVAGGSKVEAKVALPSKREAASGGVSIRTSKVSTREEAVGRGGDVSPTALGGEKMSERQEAPRGGQGSSLEDSAGELPLQTHSSLLPVSSKSLFPAQSLMSTSHMPLEGDCAAIRLPSSSKASSSETERVCNNGASLTGNKEIAMSAAAAWRRPHREATVDAPRVPQDEMDAFVTSWPTEHQRRRGIQGAGDNGRRVSVDLSTAGSPRPTPSASPPRDLRKSRTRSITHSSGDNHGERGCVDLEESLAATSRLMGLPLPMPPPTPGTAGGGSGGGRRRRNGRFANGNDGAELCEQSLSSDSMLYYLTNQHQGPAGEGMRKTPPNGGGYNGGGVVETTVSRSRTRYLHDVGGRARGDGGGGGLLRKAAVRENFEEEEPMSPLTRLLAATDVRLGNGGPRSLDGGDDSDSGMTAASNFPKGDEEDSRRLASNDEVDFLPPHEPESGKDRLATPSVVTQGEAGERRNHNSCPAKRFQVKVPSREQMEAMLETNLELDTSNNSITPAHCGPASGGTFPENRISAVGASPVSSRQSGGGGGGGAPARTRATWGAPIGGDDSVATAITEKGGGLPWEEISDVLESSSSVL